LNRCVKCGSNDLPTRLFIYGKGTEKEYVCELCTFCYTDESIKIYKDY